jgi:type I restriction-modification system, S subunit
MKNKVYNLFEICNPKQWKTISIDNLDNNGKYPVYGANGIIGYYSEYNHEKPTLCITCRGATSGELNISTSYSYINGNTMALDDLDETKVDINFLYYYLKKRGFKDIISGSAQPQITRISLKKINIPLYTLNFQKKVVSHIKKIEDIIKFKKNQLLNLTELVKSLFTTMFGDIKTNDKNWEIYYWKDVLNIKNGKNQKQVEDINGKYPIYGSGGIIGRSNAYICNENSIIIGRKGNINKPILVKEKFWNVDTAFGLEVKSEKMSYHYLYYFCLFYDFEIHNKAVTIPSLVKSDLEKIVLPIPPMELQNKFAERIEKIEKLKFEIEKSIGIAQNLYDSLISKYFDN